METKYKWKVGEECFWEEVENGEPFEFEGELYLKLVVYATSNGVHGMPYEATNCFNLARHTRKRLYALNGKGPVAWTVEELWAKEGKKVNKVTSYTYG